MRTEQWSMWVKRIALIEAASKQDKKADWPQKSTKGTKEDKTTECVELTLRIWSSASFLCPLCFFVANLPLNGSDHNEHLPGEDDRGSCRRGGPLQLR